MASSLRADEEIAEIYCRHVDTVYRICYSFMKNGADTEDMVQETFLKFISCKKRFASIDHEKAWLIVTAANTCKDELKHWKRRVADIRTDMLPERAAALKENSMLELILELPVKYKKVVYLYYYEGYHTSEIARILHCPESTVRNQLSRARKLLAKNCRQQI